MSLFPAPAYCAATRLQARHWWHTTLRKQREGRGTQRWSAPDTKYWSRDLNQFLDGERSFLAHRRRGFPFKIVARSADSSRIRQCIRLNDETPLLCH